MFDIHSHVLWGIDDGSPELDVSVEMCRKASECGTTVLFATPHLMYWEDAEYLFDKRNYKLEKLRNILEENDIKVKLVPGFEILCDDDIFNIKYFKPYTLCDSDYILIEFDFAKPDEEDVVSWCRYLSSNGLIPIIAHPERYDFVLSDLSVIERLSALGVLFQVNCGSLAGVFGEAEETAAVKMLNAGYVDFIGSDAHHIEFRNTDMSKFIRKASGYADMKALKKAAIDNPKYIIKNIRYVPERKDGIK